RYAEIAVEFVQLKVAVIVTYATAPVIAAKKATSVIPIVFALAGDPVGSGLVASLARPGSNVTGLSLQTPDIAARWASKPRPWKSGEGRTSCPPSRRSRAAPMHFMLLATRSLTPTGFASTFWRWAHDCQRFPFSARMSKREV